MIRVTNTPNLTGITISGDFDDLDGLVDALYAITITDFEPDLTKKDLRLLNISLRVLGLAYDVRHAAQGDREVYTEPNAIQQHHLARLGSDFPTTNARFACNILYPESILMNMAMNELVMHRMLKLAKSRYEYDAPTDQAVTADRAIAVIRLFQSCCSDAIGEVLSKPSLTRWRNIVYDRLTDVAQIAHPFVDSWNLRYLKMDRETRAKKLGTITKRLAEYRYDSENMEYRRAIDEFVEEHGCAESDVRFDGLDYPEQIEW